MKMNMKKIFSWGMMLAAAFTLTNCAKEIDAPVQEPESNGYPFEIIASTVDTKTVNDGVHTLWADGDQINVFHALGDDTEYVNDGVFTVADLESGRFTGTINEELDPEEEYDWYVMYPYNAKITTPGTQTAGYTYIGYRDGMNQTGYNSTASLNGSACPLYGVAKYAGVRPEITMNHLSSVVAINVTNMNDEPLTITSASLTAPEDIVGSYYIDVTKTPIEYTASGANYVNATAIVNVSNGTALAKGESAILYAAIKPFTATAGQKLTLSVNGYSKEIELSKDVTFSAGKIKTLNFKYDEVEEPEDEVVETYTWDLTKASYSSASATEVKWESDYVNMVLTKGSSTTNANNYLGGTNAHTRVYKDQILKFTSADGVVVQSVEFNVVSGYMDEFEGATWTNATATTSGSVRKVVPTDTSKEFSVKIGTATRFNTIKVYCVIDENYVPPTLESIKVENAKTEYYVGDDFEEPDVFAVYTNSNEYKVTEGVTFSGFDSSVASESQVVTVTYEGKTCTYNVTISEKQEGGVAPAGTVLWSENWGTYTGTVANYKFTGTTVYGGSTTGLKYSVDNTNDKIESTTANPISSNNLFFYKSAASSWTIEGINLAGATSVTLKYTVNRTNVAVYYSIDGAAEKQLTSNSTTGVNTKTISNLSGSTLKLRFNKTGNSQNCRIDDISVTAN